MGVGKFLDPKNDFAFKQIFGTEKNKDILIHFLNDMIPFPSGTKVSTVTFLKTSLDPEIAISKQSVVDVLCMDEQGNQYIVEMQVTGTRGFEKRAQYYAARAYSSQMGVGDDYYNLKEIIFLAITDFIMFPGAPAYKSDHVILEKNTLEHHLKDFYFCFVELPKFKKNMHELTNLVEKWTYFFKHATDTFPQDLKEIIGDDVILEKAYTALNQFYWSPDELSLYEQQLKRQRDQRAIEAAFVDRIEAIYREKEAIYREKEAVYEHRIAAYEDKIVAYEDKIVACEDKIVACEDKIVACEDKIVAYEEEIAVYEDKILEEKEEERLSIARQLLSRNIPPEIIRDATLLSLEEIESLAIPAEVADT